jgi:hypothetical protein
MLCNWQQEQQQQQQQLSHGNLPRKPLQTQKMCKQAEFMLRGSCPAQLAIETAAAAAWQPPTQATADTEDVQAGKVYVEQFMSCTVGNRDSSSCRMATSHASHCRHHITRRQGQEDVHQPHR